MVTLKLYFRDELNFFHVSLGPLAMTSMCLDMFKRWLGTDQVPSQYLNKWWPISETTRISIYARTHIYDCLISLNKFRHWILHYILIMDTFFTQHSTITYDVIFSSPNFPPFLTWSALWPFQRQDNIDNDIHTDGINKYDLFKWHFHALIY